MYFIVADRFHVLGGQCGESIIARRAYVYRKLLASFLSKDVVYFTW